MCKFSATCSTLCPTPCIGLKPKPNSMYWLKTQERQAAVHDVHLIRCRACASLQMGPDTSTFPWRPLPTPGRTTQAPPGVKSFQYALARMASDRGSAIFHLHLLHVLDNGVRRLEDRCVLMENFRELPQAPLCTKCGSPTHGLTRSES